MVAATIYPAGNNHVPFTGHMIVRNYWTVADGKTEVVVQAGVSTDDPSEGFFTIFREQGADQALDHIIVPGTGAVWISAAPLGASVETSAQTGDLSFDSASGETGTLHLSDDTVSIDTSATPGPTAS